jgi:NTE family protein
MRADIVIAVNLNTGIVGRSMYGRKERRDIKRKRIRGPTKLSGKIANHLDHTWHRGKSLVLEKFGLDQKGRGPSLFEVLVASIHIMQDHITCQRLAADPPDILISPRVAQIGLLDFNRAEEAIEAGSKATEYSLPLLQEILT